ncbi:MAG: hypothetical protein JXQ87_08405 [Bacteroidia bacterium]
MKKVILISVFTALTVLGFSQQKQMYVLNGESIIFKINTSYAVSWFYQAASTSTWQKIGDRSVLVYNRGEGKLFGTILYDDFTLEFTDTVTFYEPHKNAATGVFIRNRFYPTVELNGRIWLAEDVDGDFTYEEAMLFANSVPGWSLPENYTALKPKNGGQAAYSSFAYPTLYNYALAQKNTTGKSELLLDEASGFNAKINSPFGGNKNENVYYWMYSGKTYKPTLLGLVKSAQYQPSQTSNDVSLNLKCKVRLVKDLPSVNLPPEQPVMLWPFAGQRDVTTEPMFQWKPVADPEGDSVYYVLHYYDYFRTGERGYIVTKDTTYTPVVPFGNKRAIIWNVKAYDNKGNYFYRGTQEFFTHEESTTGKTNPGDFNNVLLKIIRPQNGNNIITEKARVEVERFSDNSKYEVYLGLQNPPKRIGVEQSHRFNTPVLQRDETYYLQVKAIDKTSNLLLAQSNVISFTTGTKTETVGNTGDEYDPLGEDESVTTTTAGEGAVITSDLLYDLDPTNAKSVCVGDGKYTYFVFSTKIEEQGEYRIYIRPKSNLEGAANGWQMFRVSKFIDFGDNKRGGIHVYPASLNPSYKTDSLEWMVSFYSKNTGKEIYKSPLQTIKLGQVTTIEPPTVSIANNEITWTAIDGADSYELVFEEDYRDCYRCRTTWGCGQERQFSMITDKTSVAFPECKNETQKYSVMVRSNQNEGCATSAYSSWQFVRSCPTNECPEYLWKKTKNNEDNGSGGSGGGGGGEPTLSSTDAIVISWKSEKSGKWKAVGPLQYATSGYSTEAEALNTSLYTCQKGNYTFLKTCGQFYIYTLTDCDMGISEEDAEKAINRVHSYLLNNGCDPY